MELENSYGAAMRISTRALEIILDSRIDHENIPICTLHGETSMCGQDSDGQNRVQAYTTTGVENIMTYLLSVIAQDITPSS